MIGGRWISPDWVGTARAIIEEALRGLPVMYVQGFCGDVNCHHIFGTPKQAQQTGTRLGRAAVEALPMLLPVRTVPFHFARESVRIPCQPMPSRQELRQQIEARQRFCDALEDDPSACWCCGINLPEPFSVAQKRRSVGRQIDWLSQAINMIEAGQQPPTFMTLHMAALRLGDLAAVFCPGENFTMTGQRIRNRSPFVHTLICGDTNGLFGYIGDDAEIDRGGYETDSFWKLPMAGFRMPPAKRTVTRIIKTAEQLLKYSATVPIE